MVAKKSCTIETMTMKKKLNPIEFLTGFLMGAFMGICLDLGFSAYNLLCAWLGWAKISVTWWMLIPLPLVLGLVMGRAIASLHLEDY
jgi:hypothetical protein